MSCCVVEPWIYGHVLVKFDTEKELVMKPLLGRRQCPETARRVAVTSEGFVLKLCPEHAKKPICGGVLRPLGEPCDVVCDCGGTCSIRYEHDVCSCSGNIPDDCEA